MKRWLAAVVFLGWLAGTAPAAAQESGRPSGARGSDRIAGMKSRYVAWRDRGDWLMFASYSTVFFNEPAFEQVLEHEGFPLVRFGLGRYWERRVGLELSAGGMYEQSFAVGEVSGKASGETLKFYVVPVQVAGRYRFFRSNDQWVVPSVWAGFDWWWFKEDNESTEDVEGDKTNWRWGVDLDFLLDPLDPAAARLLKNEYGIENTYFYVGYEGLSSTGEKGLDFSGWMLVLGLRLEVPAK